MSAVRHFKDLGYEKSGKRDIADYYEDIMKSKFVLSPPGTYDLINCSNLILQIIAREKIILLFPVMYS